MIGTTLAIAAILALPTAEVIPARGETATGRLQEISQERIVLDSGGERREIPLSDVLFVQFPGGKPAVKPRTPQSPVLVMLVDGSVLAVENLEINEKTAVLRWAGGKELALEPRLVRAVRLRPASAELEGPWQKLISEPPAADVLLIERNGAINQVDGVIRGITAEAIQFDAGGVVPVPRARVAAVSFFRKPEAAMPLGLIENTSGERYSIRAIKQAKDEGLQFETGTGTEQTMAWDEIAKIDLSRGKVVYLSDMTPEKQDWRPFFSFSAEPAPWLAKQFGPLRDRARDGSNLSLSGRVYSKGVLAHSRTELVYRLPEGFRFFLADVGLARSEQGVGHVRLLIEVDDRPLVDRAVAAADEMFHVEQSVAGGRRLRILVDYGENGDVGDELILGDARVAK